MWIRLRCVVALTMLLLGSSRAVVRADAGVDDARARAHFIAGESHFAAGRWSDAVREFTLAYELSERQEMLINRSRAYERDGRYEEARADLMLLLARHPDSTYRPEAETRLVRLDRLLAAQPKPAAAEPTPEAEPPTIVEPKASEAAPEPLPPSRAPSWPVITLGGGALIAGAVALGTGLRAHALYGELEGDCPEDLCPAARGGDRDRGRTLARTSTGLTFAALALVGGAVGMYVRALRHPRVALDVDAHAAGATTRLRVRF